MKLSPSLEPSTEPSNEPSVEPLSNPRKYSAGVRAALALFRKKNPLRANQMDDLSLLTLALGNAGNIAARAILAHIGGLDHFDTLGSARHIMSLKLERVGWSTATRCEVIYETTRRIIGISTGGLDSGILAGRKRRRTPILRRIAQEMRRGGEALQASQMSDLELLTAYLESARAAKTLLEALSTGGELEGSLLTRLDTIGSADTLIDWGGIHLGTAARIEVLFEVALRIAGVMPDTPEALKLGQVFTNR